MEFDYNGKMILAPMVRIGTLPTRLLALEFGADLVYCDELIDYRILKCQRIENDILGTVDYVDCDNQIVYRTCPLEKGRNIMQIGTCSPERAAEVARFVKNDVAGIDINMGCPKEFSMKGGMGAALLSQPDKIVAILEAVVNEVPDLLVTCKIRVFQDVDKTIELCRRIEITGVRAIGVHGRTKDERPQHPNRNHTIKAIAQAIKIPVIANGGSSTMKCRDDIEAFRRDCGAAAVMVARAAEDNVSVFRKEGPLEANELIQRYLKVAIEWDNRDTNTKYVVQAMLGSQQESPMGKRFLGAQLMEDICDVWEMKQLCLDRQLQLAKTKKLLNCGTNENEHHGIKRKRDETSCEIETKFIRTLFNFSELPKTVLLNLSRKEGLEQPEYKTKSVDKYFRSKVIYKGITYSSCLLEKNKKNAEQAAALVCLYDLGIVGDDKLRSESQAKLNQV